MVLADRAAVFTDGRYTTQLAQQTDPALWERRHVTEEPPAEWLKAHAAGKRIGYDPWLHAEAGLKRLEAAGATLVPLDANPVDAVWTEAGRPRPPPRPRRTRSTTPAVAAAEKREEAAAALREAGEDAAVLADAHSVAWLLNIRGADLDHTPLVLAFALLRADGAAELFLDPARVPARDARASRQRRPAAPAASPAGGAARPRPAAACAWTRMRRRPGSPARLREAGAAVVAGEDPCRLPRARKNAVGAGGRPRRASARRRRAGALPRLARRAPRRPGARRR